jgi:hypothetical protein
VKPLAFLTLLAAAGAALSPLPLLAVSVVAVGLLLERIYAWAGPRRQGTAAKTGANPRLGAPPAYSRHPDEELLATIYLRSGRLVLRRRRA